MLLRVLISTEAEDNILLILLLILTLSLFPRLGAEDGGAEDGIDDGVTACELVATVVKVGSGDCEVSALNLIFRSLFSIASPTWICAERSRV